MLAYPVTLTPDTNGTFLVEFIDFPEANSVGDDQDEALLNAVDALETAIEFYVDDRQPVPMPSPAADGQFLVELPPTETAKVLLWNEMLKQDIRKAELARRLNVHMPQVDRLLDIRHSTKLEFITQAAAALGKKISVSFA